MLSAIVPTRDRWPRLRLALESFAEAHGTARIPDEVIVVDDGSRDDTARQVDALAARYPIPLTLVRRASPRGRSAARNAGASQARGDVLLFSDDDILVDGALLAGHAGAHGAAPVLARGTVLNLPWLRAFRDPLCPPPDLPPRLARQAIPAIRGGTLASSVAMLARRSRFEADLHWLLAQTSPAYRPARWLAATGGNLSVSRQLFAELGGFDEQMGLRWGAEDLELGYRATRHGAQVVHLAEAAAYHMDHPVDPAERRRDHAAALRYFDDKHHVELGCRLWEYFGGAISMAELAAMAGGTEAR